MLNYYKSLKNAAILQNYYVNIHSSKFYLFYKVFLPIVTTLLIIFFTFSESKIRMSFLFTIFFIIYFELYITMNYAHLEKIFTTYINVGNKLIINHFKSIFYAFFVFSLLALIFNNDFYYVLYFIMFTFSYITTLSIFYFSKNFLKYYLFHFLIFLIITFSIKLITNQPLKFFAYSTTYLEHFNLLIFTILFILDVLSLIISFILIKKITRIKNYT